MLISFLSTSNTIIFNFYLLYTYIMFYFLIYFLTRFLRIFDYFAEEKPKHKEALLIKLINRVVGLKEFEILYYNLVFHVLDHDDKDFFYWDFTVGLFLKFDNSFDPALLDSKPEEPKYKLKKKKDFSYINFFNNIYIYYETINIKIKNRFLKLLSKDFIRKVNRNIYYWKQTLRNIKFSIIKKIYYWKNLPKVKIKKIYLIKKRLYFYFKIFILRLVHSIYKSKFFIFYKIYFSNIKISFKFNLRKKIKIKIKNKKAKLKITFTKIARKFIAKQLLASEDRKMLYRSRLKWNIFILVLGDIFFSIYIHVTDLISFLFKLPFRILIRLLIYIFKLLIKISIFIYLKLKKRYRLYLIHQYRALRASFLPCFYVFWEELEDAWQCILDTDVTEATIAIIRGIKLAIAEYKKPDLIKPKLYKFIRNTLAYIYNKKIYFSWSTFNIMVLTSIFHIFKWEVTRIRRSVNRTKRKLKNSFLIKNWYKLNYEIIDTVYRLYYFRYYYDLLFHNLRRLRFYFTFKYNDLPHVRYLLFEEDEIGELYIQEKEFLQLNFEKIPSEKILENYPELNWHSILENFYYFLTPQAKITFLYENFHNYIPKKLYSKYTQHRRILYLYICLLTSEKPPLRKILINEVFFELPDNYIESKSVK